MHQRIVVGDVTAAAAAAAAVRSNSNSNSSSIIRNSFETGSDHDCSSSTTVNQLKKKRYYTWEEVATHNTKESCWIIIQHKVFDITSWIDRHPGGSELLCLFAGRECTNAFASYHPFSNKPQGLLHKFKIGDIDPESKTEFPSYRISPSEDKADVSTKSNSGGFYQTCQQRVGDYFRQNKLNPKDPLPGIWRMALVAIVAYGLYQMTYGTSQASYPFSIKAIGALAFGICQALPLLHIMHDCSHSSFSHQSKNWATVGRVAMDWFAGGSLVSWLNQHVVGHHIYTNVIGADPDLPETMTGDLRRIVERQVLRPLYAWQHLYLPPLYGLLGLKFRIQDITLTFFSQTNGPVRVNPHSTIGWLTMFGAKLFWAMYRIWIPLVVIKMDPTEFWSCFFLTELMTGWYLAFNFQVSHVSTVCDYPLGDKLSASIHDEWAISQVKSSVDYSHGSIFATFASGALNYQITHHLFPTVSQYHYPAIAPIIQQVCKEHGIKYHVFPSFFHAFYAHLQHLKQMGAQGIAASVHMG